MDEGADTTAAIRARLAEMEASDSMVGDALRAVLDLCDQAEAGKASCGGGAFLRYTYVRATIAGALEGTP